MPRSRTRTPSPRPPSRRIPGGGSGGWDARAIEAACAGDPARAARLLEAAARSARGRAAFLARLRAYEMWHAAGDDRRILAGARRLAGDRLASARERARVLIVFGRTAARSEHHRLAADALGEALSTTRLEPALAVTIALEAAHSAARAGTLREARRLLEWAASRGAGASPGSRWLDVHAALAEMDAAEGDPLAADDRLERIAQAGSGRRLGTGRTLAQTRGRTERQLRLRERAVAGAGLRDRRELTASLRRRPEPKLEALTWAIVAQEARRHAELSLWRGRELPDAGHTAPTPRPGEALVVLAYVSDEVHCWVIRPERPNSHFVLTSGEMWRHLASELRRAWDDASGWPDGAAPPERLREGSRSLDSAAREIWTPMWPALEGVARVAVAPDPQLAVVPWSALALAAPPSLRPRPRAVTVLPAATLPRPTRWRLPVGGVLSMSHRNASSALGEREAKAVVRLLGGEWLDAIRLRQVGSDPRRGLERCLRRVRIWHLAAPIVLDSSRPAASGVPAGDETVPLWWLARMRTRMRLMTAAVRLPVGPRGPGRGEVVGRITPEGPRRLGREGAASGAELAADEAPIARLLVGTIATRLVVNTGEADSSATAAILGSYYAGLARGDSPAESLFLAQRKAFDERIHPAVWAGFTHWGWF